jgi:hypothetical protein
MSRRFLPQQKGFILPDVMIAVFVTSGALIAIVAAMLPAIRLESSKRDEIIAMGLAQEGIEIVRNIRDNNWKQCKDASDATVRCTQSGAVHKDAFDAPFPQTTPVRPCITGLDYAYDGSAALSPVACNNRTPLVRNRNGFYTTATSAKFKRQIRIVSSDGGERQTVTSTVAFGKDFAKTVDLTDTLSAWGDQ